MNRPLIAVPVVADSIDSVKFDMDEALKNIPGKFDLFELRLDFIRHSLDFNMLDSLFNHSKIDLLITDRRDTEGRFSDGYFRSDDQRLEMLCYSVEKNVSHVDIESSTPINLIYSLFDCRKYAKTDTKIILSYHNFEKTNNLGLVNLEFSDVVHSLKRFCPDVYKIAAKANTKEDIQRMQHFIDSNPNNFIGLSMTGDPELIGAASKTRYNIKNYLTFGPYSKEKCSAPGQLTAEQLFTAFNSK